MELSREARVIAGITLITIPTVMYGGLALLGLLTAGSAGLAPGGLQLSDAQFALFRAGHAHAGVWIILSLVLQVLLDSAALGPVLKWTARVAAPVSAAIISGGFFGLAFAPAFAALVYLGAAAMALSVGLAGVGLLRARR